MITENDGLISTGFHNNACFVLVDESNNYVSDVNGPITFDSIVLCENWIKNYNDNCTMNGQTPKRYRITRYLKD